MLSIDPKKKKKWPKMIVQNSKSGSKNIIEKSHRNIVNLLGKEIDISCISELVKLSGLKIAVNEVEFFFFFSISYN